MTPLPANLRYERKFLASGPALADVVAIVRRHPALFHEVYPPRAVNNIYLDSSGLHDYFSHVHGVANRLKTRIRWYGQLKGHIANPTLERKIKLGLVGGKIAHALPALAIDGHVTRQILGAALESQDLPEMLRLALRHLKPTLLNRYQRQYWLSACGRFRLTVDWDLQFFSVRGGNVSAVPLCPRTPAVVVELKFAPDDADGVAQITNALPFRLARCSKYVLGIESLGAA
jgi:hypothetical protein